MRHRYRGETNSRRWLTRRLSPGHFDCSSPRHFWPQSCGARARCFTCSQVRPDEGCRENRSLRSRNSSRFQSGTGNCASSSAMLSQRSSTNCRRSARPSLKIGANSVLIRQAYPRVRPPSSGMALAAWLWVANLRQHLLLAAQSGSPAAKERTERCGRPKTSEPSTDVARRHRFSDFVRPHESGELPPLSVGSRQFRCWYRLMSPSR